MGTNNEDKLILGGHEFTSRFILGSGKFSLDLVKASLISLPLPRNRGNLIRMRRMTPMFWEKRIPCLRT